MPVIQFWPSLQCNALRYLQGATNIYCQRTLAKKVVKKKKVIKVLPLIPKMTLGAGPGM